MSAPGLSDDVVLSTYEQLLATGQVSAEVSGAVDVLRQLGLVTGAEPVAVSPDTARAALLLPLERVIRERTHQLAERQERLRPFEAVFDRAQRGRQPAAVCLDAAETQARLTEAAQRCTTEVVMMQSCVAHEPPAARWARPLVLDAAARGVNVRLLYPHTGRGDTVTCAYLRDVSAAGGQVRTCDDVFERFIVFDRSTAFVLAADDEDAGEAAVVHEPIVARSLGRIHQHVWQSATRFLPSRSGYGSTLGVLKSSILSLLAAGLTDDAIARRVGMSERTLRRHIAAIMRDMAAESRFQAGVAVARAGLLEPIRHPSPESDRTEQETLRASESARHSRR